MTMPYLESIDQDPIPEDRALRMRDVAAHAETFVQLAIDSEIDDRWEID